MLRHNLFIITGGNRGFGLAIAKALQAHKESKHLTTIVLVGRDSASLEQAATSLIGPSLKCFSIGNAELDNIETIDKLVLPEIRRITQVCMSKNHLCPNHTYPIDSVVLCFALLFGPTGQCSGYKRIPY